MSRIKEPSPRGLSSDRAGELAAVRGDRAGAARADAWLAAHDDLYHRGRTAWQRALIAARLGQRDRALALLQAADAVASGVYSFAIIAEWDEAFTSLRDDRRFRALLRPKG